MCDNVFFFSEVKTGKQKNKKVKVFQANKNGSKNNKKAQKIPTYQYEVGGELLSIRLLLLQR